MNKAVLIIAVLLIVIFAEKWPSKRTSLQAVNTQTVPVTDTPRVIVATGLPVTDDQYNPSPRDEMDRNEEEAMDKMARQYHARHRKNKK